MTPGIGGRDVISRNLHGIKRNRARGAALRTRFALAIDSLSEHTKRA